MSSLFELVANMFQTLKRYRMAAQNGMSVKEFSKRLLPILLKEVEVDSESENGVVKSEEE